MLSGGSSKLLPDTRRLRQNMLDADDTVGATELLQAKPSPETPETRRRPEKVLDTESRLLLETKLLETRLVLETRRLLQKMLEMLHGDRSTVETAVCAWSQSQWSRPQANVRCRKLRSTPPPLWV